MKCPHCRKEISNEVISRALASKGGRKSKRSISPEAQTKMQEARRNTEEKSDVVGKASIDWLDVIKNDGEYNWNTGHYHPDNNFTMNEFLEMLDEEIDVYLIDGTYAELRINDRNYEVHASGNGDSFTHQIQFILI